MRPEAGVAGPDSREGAYACSSGICVNVFRAEV